MSEKSISYLARNYSDYKNALLEFAKKYYPDMAIDFNDASVGSFLIDINADIADNLSYHIDRVFQETNIDSANEMSSLYALARSNGFKVPGPKGAMAEVEISCVLPPDANHVEEPDWVYAPIVRRGTKFSSSSQIFELLEDVDFRQQFDEDAYSDKTINPKLNSNGVVTAYTITKVAVVVAGESKIYKKVVNYDDIVPFMEVVLPEESVMNVESIVMVDGTNIYTNPTYGDFYSYSEEIECKLNGEKTSAVRFFEVESLAQQKRWDVKTEGGQPIKETYLYDNIPTYQVTRGEWKPINHKFITEYTDKGYLKIIFGSGIEGTQDVDLSDAKEFSKYQITRTIRNNSLGYLPNPNSTLFILYRVGGGKSSNVAKGAINTISFLNCEIGGTDAAMRDAVKRTLRVVSTTPSVSGKDMPTAKELKYLIKYNNGSKNRCVTVKDYISRTLMMPPKFGTPFRVAGAEENNKMMLYLLGIDNNGKLDSTLPTMLIENIRDYLSGYRMINDYIEIKSGRIINLAFDIDVFVDKNYNNADVIGNIIEIVSKYLDINSHNIGDEIFVGDIKKEISKVDGVINLIGIKAYNIYGGNYSSTMTAQETISNPISYTYDTSAMAVEIDLDASDYIIYSGSEGMTEIKYPERDIHVKVKNR